MPVKFKIRLKQILVVFLAVATSLSAITLSFAATGVTPEQVIAAVEGTFGVNPGQRRNHIKGVCASGEFIGSAEGRKYSRSPLFSGQPIPVVARFSLAGGNPKAPDTAKSARGLALQFQLPNGKFHQMAMLNTPIFGAAQPQTFYDLMIAMKPDPATGKPNPEALKAFKESHPDNLAQAQYLANNNPPTSYANSSYWGIHTFKFINRANKTTLVRWQFVPQDGEQRLSDEQLKSSPANFLEKALIDRTQNGPVRWDMIATIGQPNDEQNNPTIAWPENRKQVKVGTLTLTKAAPQPGQACEAINFDPLILSDGVQPTNDPILLFRSGAYAISYGKRQAGN
ncbi:catalase family peroxidase [Synechococcus sp. PCC 6312]|uniref:catalase family peroxidase n=1 Tax=Synechococcus sp. (strain ATCC 27167 / PCC 6312) TaxID=195253 RepID=UPI00209FB2E7|nr:catalase family peroxidase [Synechococcus sp. PCC 6312]